MQTLLKCALALVVVFVFVILIAGKINFICGYSEPNPFTAIFRVYFTE